MVAKNFIGQCTRTLAWALSLSPIKSCREKLPMALDPPLPFRPFTLAREVEGGEGWAAARLSGRLIVVRPPRSMMISVLWICSHMMFTKFLGFLPLRLPHPSLSHQYCCHILGYPLTESQCGRRHVRMAPLLLVSARPSCLVGPYPFILQPNFGEGKEGRKARYLPGEFEERLRPPPSGGWCK